MLAPLALAQSGAPERWSLDVVLAFAYLVVLGSCVGLVLQLWLTRRLRPTTMQLSQLIISAEALVVGGLALGEAFTWRIIAGALRRNVRPAARPRALREGVVAATTES